MTTTTRRRLIGIMVAAAVAAVAPVTGCTSSSTTIGPATTAATSASPGTTAAQPTAPASVSTNFPVTVNGANGAVTVNALPTAIVSLSPTATEMLFAIGAGKQVVAVDDRSTYPADAPLTDLSGAKPDVAAIAARKPDLVVIADDSSKLSTALAAQGIPVLVQTPATTFDDVYAQLGELGRAVGKSAEAKGVADQMSSTITELMARAPKRALRVYHEVDASLRAAASTSLVGQVYRAFGVTNIADKADADASGYPQLSSGYVVAADPEVIFLADTTAGKQDATTVSARAGWAGIAAVKNKRIVNLDDDVASRWGPRLVLLVQAVGDALAKV